MLPPFASLLLCSIAMSPASAPSHLYALSALDEPDTIELVETAPIETTLDHADIRNADVVWLELIRGAQHTLDFAEFYASDHAPSPLTPVIEAVEAAADGGVQVRFVGEEKFTKTYPEILERLGKHKNIEMRRLDYSKVAGGVLHARYFLVDGAKSWIGTSNWEKDYFYKSRNVGFMSRARLSPGVAIASSPTVGTRAMRPSSIRARSTKRRARAIEPNQHHSSPTQRRSPQARRHPPPAQRRSSR